ncbi:EamA family transporter [Leucobacter chromiireducens]|uniref:EamA family transporter n=1 Tax=Leucobacter chromiireducens TaxID=283877 RepID=UPI001F1551E3|nr:EamA family transporter [Leucobacter chromiireducens]
MSAAPAQSPARPSPATRAGAGRGIGAATALTALAPMIWGTTYFVTTEFLPAGHPLFASLVRALPAGLVVLACTRVLPRGRWWGRTLVLGALFIGVFFPLLFVAAERLPGGVAATVGALQPIIVAVLARVLLGDAVSPARLAFGALGVGGVALITLTPQARLDPIGILAALGTAVSLALGLILAKRWGRPAGVGPVAFTGWQLTAGGLMLLVPALAFEGIPAGIDGPALGGYLWLALFGGLISYTLWFGGLARIPIAAASFLGLLSPVVAISIDVLVLHAEFSAWQVLGLALTLLALVGGQLAGKRELQLKES